MKSLGTELLQRTYYVKDAVIYNIGGIVDGLDKTHGVVISATTDTDGDGKNDDNTQIEKVFLTYDDYSKSGKTKILFFDTLIETGDKYSSSTFTKTVHENDGKENSAMTYYNYYKDILCDAQIRSAIAENSKLTYKELFFYTEGGEKHLGKYFSRLGVPVWIMTGATDTEEVKNDRNFSVKKVERGKSKTSKTTADTLINITENDFKNMKKEEAAKAVASNAVTLAKMYGFELNEETFTCPSGNDKSLNKAIENNLT